MQERDTTIRVVLFLWHPILRMQFHPCPYIIGPFQGLKQLSYVSLVRAVERPGPNVIKCFQLATANPTARSTTAFATRDPVKIKTVCKGSEETAKIFEIIYQWTQINAISSRQF
jgi:hypothetical protein